MPRLENKVAIITGGGSGIGAATARLFGAEGCRVVVVDKRRDAADATTQAIGESGGMAVTVQADVTQADDVRAMVDAALQAYGRLDILFNNAGIGVQGDVVDMPEDVWDRVIDLNLTGVFSVANMPFPR